MANQDKLQLFPDQNIELRPTECVGESIADAIGNVMGVDCDPGWSYAATLRVMGVSPTTAGSDPYAGMISGVVYGALPVSRETFDATSTSELYEANLNNYPSADASWAEANAQNGFTLLGGYTEITDWLSRGNGGVVMPMLWYSAFSQVGVDGVLSTASGNAVTHCVVAYEEVPGRGLRIKPWLGPNYGAAGYAFLPETVFDQVFLHEAWAFDQTKWRWLSLVSAAVMRPQIIKDVLPQL